MRDVFKRFNGVMINVEIKTPTEEFIKIMNKLIKEFEREDLTIWGCKDPKLSKFLKKTNPRIKRFFSLGGISNLYFKYLTGNKKRNKISLTTIRVVIPLFIICFSLTRFASFLLDRRGFLAGSLVQLRAFRMEEKGAKNSRITHYPQNIFPDDLDPWITFRFRQTL
jgi:hypothetical protein